MIIFCRITGKFAKCPNCVRQLVQIPLKEKGCSMVCPFCESGYPRILSKK